MKQRFLYTLAFLFATLQISAQGTINYEYDANNRLTKVTYSSGAVVVYTYDELGNRLSKKVMGAASNIKGDANGDGKVTITDAVCILTYILADLADTSESFNEAAADVNGDGIITIADALGVMNIIQQ